MTTTSIEQLFVHNKEWSEQMERDRPEIGRAHV